MTRLPPAFVVSLLLLCTGCVSPVTFIAPCSPGVAQCFLNTPVTQGAITFASNFNPSNSLTVSYDGQDITGLLTPSPAPNATSIFPLPPPPNANYYRSGTGTQYGWELTAAATCGFFCVYPTTKVDFVPAGAVVSAPGTGGAPLNFSKSRGPLLVDVLVGIGATGAPGVVNVTLTAAPAGVVAFATSATGAGGPSLTLPVINGNATFYLQALGPTVGFTVTPCTAGVICVANSGTVSN